MKKLKANNTVKFSKKRLQMLVVIAIAFVVAVLLSMGTNANITTRFGWNPESVKAWASIVALFMSSLALSVVGIAFLPVFPPLAFSLIAGSALFAFPALKLLKGQNSAS